MHCFVAAMMEKTFPNNFCNYYAVIARIARYIINIDTHSLPRAFRTYIYSAVYYGFFGANGEYIAIFHEMNAPLAHIYCIYNIAREKHPFAYFIAMLYPSTAFYIMERLYLGVATTAIFFTTIAIIIPAYSLHLLYISALLYREAAIEARRYSVRTFGL